MLYLVDTPILLRLANSQDVQHMVAEAAVDRLSGKGASLYVAPQNLIEFRNGGTRPTAVNGLGMAIEEAEAKAERYETIFTLLPETPEIYPAWKALVRAAGVTGKQVHDARLVATCHVYGITHILTFNVRHFTRLAPFGPGVTIVDPTDLL